MTTHWTRWPIFWPLWAVAAMVVAIGGFLLPGELTFLVALAFTTPRRAFLFAVVGEGVVFALLFLGLFGGMILEDD